MKQIIIAGFDGALSTSITGVVDILSLTGVSWQRIMSEMLEPKFKVCVASKSGQAIRCINGLDIGANKSFEQIKYDHYHKENISALIVPTIGSPIEHTLAKNPEMLEFLQWAYGQDLTIAGNCTGNFFLAEAGLLNGREATTHWGYESLFRSRYPDVNLKAEKLITLEDRICCAGGGLAWFDLCIYMIEQAFGYDCALQTAKAFVIDYRREHQLSYGLSRLANSHHDQLIAEVQAYFEKNYQDNQALDDVAKTFNISKRTLIRRFKAALNMTPYRYLQQMRIEIVQKLLTETQLSPEQAIQKVGYEDISSFRRLFKQQTGLTLAEYRRRFAKRL